MSVHVVRFGVSSRISGTDDPPLWHMDHPCTFVVFHKCNLLSVNIATKTRHRMRCPPRNQLLAGERVSARRQVESRCMIENYYYMNKDEIIEGRDPPNLVALELR